MKLNIMRRTADAVQRKPFGGAKFRRRATLLMGPIRVDMWFL